MLDLRAESEVLKTAPFGTVTLSQEILSLLTCDRRTARVIKLRREVQSSQLIECNVQPCQI